MVGDIGHFGCYLGMKEKTQDALEPYKRSIGTSPAGLKDRKATDQPSIPAR